MKKFFAIVLALVMVLSLAACGTADAPAAAEAKDKKIGVVVFQDDMFFQMWTAGCNAAAEEAGWVANNSNYNTDAGQLANLIQTYIDQEYDAVALQLSDIEVGMTYATKASEAGMVVGVAGQMDEEQMKIINTAVATDPFACGKAAGELAVKYLKDNGKDNLKVGIVQFMGQLPFYSAARSETFLSMLDEAGISYEVVADQDAAVQDEAVTVCTDMLTANPDIDLIYAANDGATVGCTMAVKNLGMSDSVMIFGCDASEQICDLLLDESCGLIATAAQDSYGIGYRLTKALIDEAEGRANEDIGVSVAFPALGLSDLDPDAVKEYSASLASFH